jgi:hypothetical protein
VLVYFIGYGNVINHNIRLVFSEERMNIFFTLSKDRCKLGDRVKPFQLQDLGQDVDKIRAGIEHRNAQLVQISGPACITRGVPQWAQIRPSFVAAVRQRTQSSYWNATARSGCDPNGRPQSVVTSPGSGSIRWTFLVVPIRTGCTVPR